MSVALAPIAQKLGCLIRMLGSPIDGEVIGAARAMVRVLSARGVSLHDVADLVEQPSGASVAPKATQKRKPKQAPRPGRRGRRAPTWDELAIGYRLRWLDAALRAGATTAWERQFVADIRRLIAADSRRSPSPRQRRILDALIASAWRAGAQP